MKEVADLITFLIALSALGYSYVTNWRIADLRTEVENQNPTPATTKCVTCGETELSPASMLVLELKT